MTKLNSYNKEHLGNHDLIEMQKVVEWYKKKFREDMGTIYLFTSDDVIVFTCSGDERSLKALNIFYVLYSKYRRLLSIIKNFK